MSTHFAGQLGSEAGVRDDQLIQDSGSGGSIKYRVFPYDVASASLTDGDVVMLGSFKSNDRIKSISVDITSTMGAGATMDMGFYQSIPDHSGAVVEIDTFADAYSIAAAIDMVDVFLTAVGGGGATTILKGDRGKELWELVGLAEDPSEQWDLVVTLNDVGTSDFTGGIHVEVVNAE